MSEQPQTAFVTKNNTGALFSNRYKAKDGQPDRTGTVAFNDEEFRISAWDNVSKTNTKYMSLALAVKGDWTQRGKGVLFRNGFKNAENTNDYSGNITVDGDEYIVTGWDKMSAKGLAYVSLSFQSKDDLHPMGVGKEEKDTALDDNIPF